MADILFYLKIYHLSGQMFRCDEDYQACLENIEVYSKKYFSKIHVFCMLPNCCHLLIETSNPFLSRFVSALSKKNTSGNDKPIYQYIMIEKNSLSAETSFYIHALPYLTGLEIDPEVYPWSSLKCYCSQKKDVVWLETDCILSQISYKYLTAYKDYSAKFQLFLNNPSSFFIENLIKNIRDSKIIGSKKFKNTITELNLKKFPEVQKKISLNKINDLVETGYEYDEKSKLLAKLFLSYLYSGETNRQTGNFFGGLSPSRVSQLLKKARLKTENDDDFKKFLKKTENSLQNN